VSTRACEGLAAIGAAEFATVSGEATKLGGARCLARLAKAWTEFEREELWVTATQTTDAQREAFAVPAEGCLGQLEKRASSDETIGAYMEVKGAGISAGPHLTAAQGSRLTALQASLPRDAAKTLAAGAKDSPAPATQALGFAVAAALSAEAKDSASAASFRAAARSALAREGTAEHITVALEGDGSAESIAASVSRSLGQARDAGRRRHQVGDHRPRAQRDQQWHPALRDGA